MKFRFLLCAKVGCALLATLGGACTGNLGSNDKPATGGNGGVAGKPGSNGPPANLADQVTLPLEVFGVDGIVREVSFPLNQGAFSGAKKVALRLHNVRYPTKASVQLNDDAWKPITNDTVEVSGPAKSFGGIGGGFAVLDVKFDVPARSLLQGSNTLRFRFEKTDGLSMGYRVIGIDLLDGAGASVLPSNLFVQDNPSKWSAPSGADAKAGQALWTTAVLQEGPDSSAKLRAKCSDCHAEDGRDLKYFNYSNFSIVERAKFHGLSEQQGKNIAAHIRNLDVVAPGRPWNPPFQPGAGNTDRPIESFSAGAGIDAIVDEDATIAAIFKAGFDRTALADGNALRRIAVSDIPIGLQLPDWNHWLPEIHPKDIVGEAFDASGANVGWKALADRLASKQGPALDEYLGNPGDAPFLYQSSGARADFNGWRNKLWELRSMTPGVPIEGDPPQKWTDKVAKQTYAIAVWGQVRTWELMNRFGLERYAVQAYPSGETRAWFSERHLFDTSPFLQGIRGGPGCAGEGCEGRAWTGSSIGNTEVNYDYLSNSWYHLQLELNAGQRVCGGHRCTDYGYAFGFLNHISGKQGLYEGGRRLLWGIKAMEEHDAGKGPILYDGFSLATSNPLRPLGLGEAIPTKWWTDSAHPDRSKALSITAQVFAEKLGSFTVEEWRTANYGKGEDGANFMDATRVVDTGGDETISRSIGDGFWFSLPPLKEVRLHPAVVNALARFGLAMWPRNNWMEQGVPLTGAAPAAPTVRASQGSVKVQWAGGATSYNVFRATSAEGPWLAVALLREGSSFTDVPLTKGVTYHYAVSANGPTSESPMSPAKSVTRT